MNKVNIGIDVDDVLAGFYPAMCKYFSRFEEVVDIWDGDGACKWVREGIKEIEYNTSFWKNLPVIQDPKSINFDFSYYISSFPEEMYDARVHWLRANGFPDKPLICTDDKLSVCRDKGINVFVDDKKSTIKELNENGILGVRFRPYYMIEDGQDIDRLDQLPGFIADKYLNNNMFNTKSNKSAFDFLTKNK